MEESKINIYMKTQHIERGLPMIRIIICDDSPVFLNEISDRLSKKLASLDVDAKVHSFQSLSEIGDRILKSCDIAFLDIDLEQETYNGLDIAKKIRLHRQDSVIIFITNYIEFAPDGYEVQAFRYLLKKDLESKLDIYLSEAIEQLRLSKEIIKIKDNGEIIDLPLRDIIYIEAQLRKVRIYVQKPKGIKEYTCYGSISVFEEQLEAQGFLRVHKSYLVNMSKIKKFQHDKLELHNGSILRVSEKNYAELKKRYLLWKGY